MKKLLAIVASALTLGAFAADSDIHLMFEAPAGASAEKTYTVIDSNDAVVDATLDFGCLPYYIVATIAAEAYPNGGVFALVENGIVVSEAASGSPMSGPALVSLLSDGEGNDTIAYDETHTDVVYISNESYKYVVVNSGTINFAHNDSGYTKTNFPANSTVEVKEGAVAELTRWGGATNRESISGGGDYTINLDGITFTGDGVVKVKKPSDSVAAIVNGTIHGDGTIEFEDIGTVIDKVDHALVFADDWTGTIKLPAIETVGGDIKEHNLDRYGTDKSKVGIAGIGGGWIARGINVKPTLVLNGNMRISDWSQDTYTFAAIEGAGAFTVVKRGNYFPNMVTISKIDLTNYTGTITSEVNLTITSLITDLEEVPTEKTCVLALGEGSDTTKITVNVKLADGTAIDAANVFIEEDGIYVGPVAPAYPEFVPETEEGRAAYDTWSTKHAEAIATATEANIKAGFILNCAPTEDALKTVADENITADLVAALSDPTALETELAKIAAKYGDKITVEMTPVTDIEGVDTTTTHLFKLKITIK